MSEHEGLLADLLSALGPANCSSDPEVVASYSTDWTGRFGGQALAVARPGDAGEVRDLLELASRHQAALIPQGGNTGLVGASVPRARLEDGRPQVLLSLTRLSGVEEVDVSGLHLLAGAGTTLAAAAEQASRHGLGLGIDLSARASATLGGMAATNAGGLSVFRHGPMRERLRGIEAVLPDGSVVSELSGLAKDSVGWSPTALFAGSEGTLAIFTKLIMRLVPLPRRRLVALVAFSSLEEALESAAAGRELLSSLESMELTLRAGMELAVSHFALPAPVGLKEGAGAWLTIELAGSGDLESELGALVGRHRPLSSAVASEAPLQERLWAYRERQSEAVSRQGVPHKLDVAVPAGRLAGLFAGLAERLAGLPSSELYIWAHLAESNLHVNVIGPPPEDQAVDDAVIDLVCELGGSISAEHGVGIAKAGYLRRARPPGNLALMQRVKAALDPERLLNPGVLEPT